MTRIVEQYNMIAPILSLGVAMCLVALLYSRFHIRCLLLLLVSTTMGFSYSLVLWFCLGILHLRPSEVFIEAIKWWYAAGVTLEIAAVTWCFTFVFRMKSSWSASRISPAMEQSMYLTTRTTSLAVPIGLVILLLGVFMALFLAVFPAQKASHVAGSAEMNKAIFYDINTALQAYKDQHGMLPATLADLHITNFPCGASTSWLSKVEYSCESYSNGQTHGQRFRLDRRLDNNSLERPAGRPESHRNKGSTGSSL